MSDLIIDGEIITLSGIQNYDNVYIKNGGILEIGGDGTIQINASSITIDTTSSIIADGKGYSGGSSTTGDGQGPGAGQGGSYAGGGAGYGGKGGNGGGGQFGGQTYGDPSDISIDRGSGGACGVYYSSYGIGGNGGGSIELIADTISIYGIVSTNGSNGTTGSGRHGSGGGSGGGILINGTFVTIKGTIRSNGGIGSDAVQGYDGGGGGGGGRIKIFYRRPPLDISGAISASGSSGGTGTFIGQGGFDGTASFLPTAGYLNISSTPSGAKIYVDDVDTALYTPNTILDLSPGSHKYELILANHIPSIGYFDIIAGNTTSLDIPLIPLLPTEGYLYIASTPPGAKIYIDNIDIGLNTPNTIQNLAIGTHTYKLTLTGYNDITGSFNIIAGQVTIIEAELSRLAPKGYLYIASTPPGAKIYIDNIDTGLVTPLMIRDITEGIHTYKLALIGYHDIIGSLDIIADQITIIESILVLLVPVTGYLYIASTPPGAKIYIDNIDTGKVTSMIIPDLSPGTHNYRLTLPKYKDDTGNFDIESDKINVVYKELLKLSTGCQSLTSSPKGSTVYVDNVSTDKLTPTRICNYPIGTWPIKMDGIFESPKSGCIAFDSLPKSLRIIIDEIDTGKATPSKICNISTGIHTFRLEGVVSIT